MRRFVIAGLCALGLSAAPYAQGTTQGSTAPRSATPAPDNKVVMRGCVERADQLVPAGGSPIGTTVDSLDFVLTHAELADSPHPVTPQATGTSGKDAPGFNGIGTMYRLDGRLESLNPQVGHHVEITGTNEPSGTGSKPLSANAVNPTAANAPIIRVESVKMLGETCAR